MDIIGAIIGGIMFLLTLLFGVYIFGSHSTLAIILLGAISALVLCGNCMSKLFAKDDGEWDL